MKLCTVAAVLLVSLFATSMALPAQRRIKNYRPSSPQRLVVMQRLVAAPVRRAHHPRSAAFTAADSAGDVGAIEQQTAAESVLNAESDVEPYAPAGGQVSSEFEGSYADGGADTAVAGAEEIPADEVPAFADAPAAPEAAAQPELPELPQSGELPEAPIEENQILENESPEAPAADLPSDDAAREPKEIDAAAEAPVDAAAEAPVEAPVAEDAVPELSAVPEIPEVPAVPSIAESAEGAPAASADEAPIAAAGTPIAAPAAPATPPKRYLPPRRKVSVKLEGDAADDDAAANNQRPARIPNARRPAKGNTAVANKGKGAKAPLPAGTFFPISFGGTAGGAIAIANSFSTGEGGSATSHAIAYGSPDAARAKGRPSRRRH